MRGATSSTSVSLAFAALRNAAQDLAVGPVGDENADLAAGEALGSVEDDAQGGRRFEVGDRRSGGCRWLRVGVEAEPVCDALGEALVDVAQVGDHPSANPGLLALAQLEDECIDDMGLFDGCLADVELAAWL